MTQMPNLYDPAQLAYLNWMARNQHSQQQAAMFAQSQQQNQQNALSQEYQRAMDLANEKNETRYLDILSGRYGTRDRLINQINEYGQSMIGDANERYKQQAGAATQDAYARGFGGSPSVLAAGRNQAERSRDMQLNRINDQILQQRVGVDANQSEAMHAFMERKNEVAPDLNQLIGLQRQLGQGGSPFGSYAGGYQQGNQSPLGAGPYQPSYGGYSPGTGGVSLPGGGRPGEGRPGYQQPSQSWPVALPPDGQLPYMPNYGGYSPGTGGASLAGTYPGGAQLKGMGSMVATPYMPLVMPEQPSNLNSALAARRAEQERATAARNAQYNMHSAYGSTGYSGLGRHDNIANAQGKLLYQGQGSFSPQQMAPTIPGMAGGPIGPYLGGYGSPLSSYGGGYVPPRNGNEYGYNQGGAYLRRPERQILPRTRYQPTRGYIQRGISAPMISAPTSDIQYV